MLGKLLRGKAAADRLLATITLQTKELQIQGTPPHLGVILVGDDKPSFTYVQKKQEAAEQVGIAFTRSHLPQESTTEDVIDTVQKMQETLSLTGLIVQLPLPKHIDTQAVLDAIDPNIDVDCLTTENVQQLENNTGFVAPPTPLGVFSLITEAGVDSLKGKHVTIFGRGPLVGKPLATMMKQQGAIVSVCHSQTPNPKELSLQADIIATGVGKKDIVRGDMVKEGAVVIDTGVVYEGAKMYGDVNVKEAREHAAYVTPTPGGVGPLTVAHLLNNTIICAKRIAEEKKKTV